MAYQNVTAEIEALPDGPQIGALFDFDGTIISGYSVFAFFEEQFRRGHMSPRDVVELLAVAASFGIVVGGTAAFLRGDCNTDRIVDIADPAATMSYLFLNVFEPACLDACDSNDDGLIDLADVVSTLRFLYKLGPMLPEPGPFQPAP